MGKLFYICTLIILAPAFAGCGGKSDARPVFTAEILSDHPADGDIARDPLGTFTITQGVDTLFFGIDDLDPPNFPEFRAFLTFPLDGSTGHDVVPATARIVSATLEVFINQVSFASIVPTLLDQVIYPVTRLRAEDFGSPPLLSRALDFFATDEESFVAIDVTPMMREAQRLELLDFQVRFLLDIAANFGFVGIENLAEVSLTAPLLIVEYTL